MKRRPLARSIGARVVRIADLAGTGVFALEGALAAVRAGFDPVGILVLAFVTALGGGVARDVMLGVRPAAIAGPQYALLVILAALVMMLPVSVTGPIEGWPVIALDAAGLALFAVAGTEKALDNGVHPLPASFLGTVGAVGGGVIRDLLLGQVPHILHSDIYASAAFLAAVIVVAGRALGINPRRAAVVAAAACFAVRLAAVAYGWQLPRVL
jgi:uncharacterized membrane protein YeiH